MRMWRKNLKLKKLPSRPIRMKKASPPTPPKTAPVTIRIKKWSPPTPPKKVPVTPVRRARRASVSCTTPSNKNIMSTPTRKARSVTKKSVSETKKSRRRSPTPCSSENEDSEDDFVPTKAGVMSASDSSWSDDDDDNKLSKKKNTKTPTKATPG